MATDLKQPIILARAGRYTNPRRKGDVLPLVYGDLTVGGAYGVWECPCINITTFVYAVAGHAILSVANGNVITVYDKDDQVIAGANYTFSASNNYESKGAIATLTFTGDRHSNEPITIRCKGKDDGAGALITNPMAVIYNFLTAHVGLDASEINSTWRTRTESFLTGQSIAVAGVIDSDPRPDQTINEVFGSYDRPIMASWWRNGKGELIFKPHIGAGSLSTSDVVAYITPKHFQEEAGGKSSASYDWGQVCTRLAVEYAYNWAKREYEEFDDGSTKAAAAAEARYGKAVLIQQELPWVRTQAITQTLQQIITGYYGQPPMVLAGSLAGMAFAHLEPGDVISISVDWLYDSDGLELRNQFFRLVSTSVDLTANAVEFEALDVRSFLLSGANRDRTLYA